ncbi:MAG TPA: hypothetical protein VLE53_04985 [Gemmatimonadaceae bacterium]|nr:hypothetical protein [Gemmatimonadaceae bacterium]
MMRALRIGVAFMLASAWPVSLHAQREQYAPLVLQLPATARGAGLGGASVAVRDLDAIFANPALTGVASGTAMSLARFSEFAGMGAVAASSALGAFNVGIGVQFVDFEIAAQTIPVRSRVLTGSGVGAGASLAAAFALNTTFKGLRWGAAAKYVEDRVATARRGAPALDLGVATQGQTTYGIAVQNIGPAMDLGPARAELPLRVSAGAARFGVPVGPFDAGLSVSLSLLRGGFTSPAAGMEWAYTPLDGYNVAVRAGVRRPELREQQPFSGGASFTLDRFTLDYAIEDLARGAAHRLALRVR